MADGQNQRCDLALVQRTGSLISPKTTMGNFTCIFHTSPCLLASLTLSWGRTKHVHMTIWTSGWRHSAKRRESDRPSRVYRSSVHLFFHVDDFFSWLGSRWCTSSFPGPNSCTDCPSAAGAPQQLSENLYNCSVPHFHSFKPLLSCNMVTECQGNQDEEDCDYHTNVYVNIAWKTVFGV